jgi:hypothetical protein
MADLETLLAHHEISQVIYRYARGIDRFDLDLVRSCYHPDAHDQHGNMEGDVDAFIDMCRRVLPAFEATQHFMGNLLIEVDGDRARAETYAVIYHRIKKDDGTGKDEVWGIRYVDRFERRDGAWRIAYRVVAQEWRRVDPVAAGRIRDFGGGLWGTRDGHDAIDWVMTARASAKSSSE